MALADIPVHVAAWALFNGVMAGCAFLFLAILALFLATSKSTGDVG